MIALCLEKSLEFGVVWQRGSELAAVGCTASITDVLQKYPDGRMDILTAGQSVFQLEQLFDDKAYFEAAVRYVPDDAEEAPAADPALLNTYSECYRLIHGRSPAPSDGSPTAYQIASELPLELEVRQSLLEIRSETERRRYLLAALREWQPELQRIQRVKARAGGNGHG
jgi:Lon protease-like protein